MASFKLSLLAQFGVHHYHLAQRVSPSVIRQSRRLYNVGSSGFGRTELPKDRTGFGDSLEPDMVIDIPMAGVESIIEPTLKSLGLCANTPAGLVQRAMEFLHVTVDLPWWGVIATSAVIVRLCLFPVVIRCRKAMVSVVNGYQEINIIAEKMTKAKDARDIEALVRLAKERNEAMKRMSFRDAYLMPALVQGGCFSSMFVAMHGMASLPVESMRTGGLGWFQDLTLSDPLYILPLICSVTILITLETGAETGQKLPPSFKLLLRMMAPICFLAVMKFESAIAFYFCVNNAITLVQARLLDRTNLKQRLGIGEIKPTQHNSMMKTMKNVDASMKDALEIEHILRDYEERNRLNERLRSQDSDKQNRKQKES